MTTTGLTGMPNTEHRLSSVKLSTDNKKLESKFIKHMTNAHTYKNTSHIVTI